MSFGFHRLLGRELCEFLSVYHLWAKAKSPRFLQNSASLPQNSVSSLLRNSALETLLRPFPVFDSWENEDILRFHQESPPIFTANLQANLLEKFTEVLCRERQEGQICFLASSNNFARPARCSVGFGREASKR